MLLKRTPQVLVNYEPSRGRLFFLQILQHQIQQAILNPLSIVARDRCQERDGPPLLILDRDGQADRCGSIRYKKEAFRVKFLAINVLFF